MIPALLIQIATVQGALSARLLRVFMDEQVQDYAAKADRLLTVGEVARRLAVTKDWLYRHAGELSFTVRMGSRGLRFSEMGIERYLRQRQASR
jgi:excisionase family DNA binding protein